MYNYMMLRVWVKTALQEYTTNANIQFKSCKITVKETFVDGRKVVEEKKMQQGYLEVATYKGTQPWGDSELGFPSFHVHLLGKLGWTHALPDLVSWFSASPLRKGQTLIVLLDVKTDAIVS